MLHSLKKKTQISSFSHDGHDFEVLVDGKKISYIFEINGRRYGNAVESKSTKKQDIVDAVFNLLINYFETYAAAIKDKS